MSFKKIGNWKEIKNLEKNAIKVKFRIEMTSENIVLSRECEV